MATLNIPRVRFTLHVYAYLTLTDLQDVKDPFYRYKMERLQSKIEGKGNGIKTVVVNLSSVAASLARPSSCKTYTPNYLCYSILILSRCHQVLWIRTWCPNQ